MPITNSTYTIDDYPQADGRRWVRETHTDHNGKTYNAEYLAPDDWPYETTLAARAANIGRDIDDRERAELEAANYELPVSKYQYALRMTMPERIAARTLAKTDPIAEDALDLLRIVEAVTVSDPLVEQSLQYLASQGVIEPERIQEILNG